MDVMARATFEIRVGADGAAMIVLKRVSVAKPWRARHALLHTYPDLVKMLLLYAVEVGSTLEEFRTNFRTDAEDHQRMRDAVKRRKKA